jgi:hypothetical protein
MGQYAMEPGITYFKRGRAKPSDAGMQPIQTDPKAWRPATDTFRKDIPLFPNPFPPLCAQTGFLYVYRSHHRITSGREWEMVGQTNYAQACGFTWTTRISPTCPPPLSWPMTSIDPTTIIVTRADCGRHQALNWPVQTPCIGSLKRPAIFQGPGTGSQGLAHHIGGELRLMDPETKGSGFA